MKNFIIDVRWPSCAGKSTLVDNFLKTQKWIMHIDPDKLKWFFNDYLDDKSKYRSILWNMLLSLVEDASKNWIPVIFEWRDSIDIEKLEDIAKKYSINLYRINVEADYSILLPRFKERIKSVKAEGRVIGNMKEEGLKYRYENYLQKKRPWLELNSWELSEEQMLKELVEYIK